MRWLVVRASPPLSCRPSFVAHAQPPGPGLPEHAPSVHTSSAPSTAGMSGRGAGRGGGGGLAGGGGGAGGRGGGGLGRRRAGGGSRRRGRLRPRPVPPAALRLPDL